MTFLEKLLFSAFITIVSAVIAYTVDSTAAHVGAIGAISGVFIGCIVSR